MPSYTPPAYNAVDFNFTNPTYTPPAYNAVIFNFGGGSPPVVTLTSPPRGLRWVLMEEVAWFPRFRRDFAIIDNDLEDFVVDIYF